jgi:hypothetical protein
VALGPVVTGAGLAEVDEQMLNVCLQQELLVLRRADPEQRQGVGL